MESANNDDFGDQDDVRDIQEELAILEEADAATKEIVHAQDPLSVLYKHHPEAVLDYTETISEKLSLKSVPPNVGDADVDINHKSMPWVQQFEKATILGKRTNQLAQGARPFIVVPPHVTSTLEIARLEFEQRRLPFIIKRPMPDGSFEYWRLSDLMIL